MAKAKLKEVGFSLFGTSVTWVPDTEQQKAAWEMYVELVTRISIQKLGDDEGLLREALSSLHAQFGETRRILRAYGPEIAIPAKKSDVSFGEIAVRVLNEWLRPFLSEWHPLLSDHESRRPPNKSAYEHERSWDKAPEARTALADLQKRLLAYADLLAKVCEIPPLHEQRTDGAR
jgi:hypothetical protein